MITSGSVFVFDEDESGIKRWTDGFFWSPSRILGNFLLYRETEKRGAGHSRARAEAAATEEAESLKQEGQSLSRPKGESSRLGIDRQRERVLVGSLTNSYKFKPGGMMKKVRILPTSTPAFLPIPVCALSSLGLAAHVLRSVAHGPVPISTVASPWSVRRGLHYLGGHHRERHAHLP